MEILKDVEKLIEKVNEMDVNDNDDQININLGTNDDTRVINVGNISISSSNINLDGNSESDEFWWWFAVGTILLFSSLIFIWFLMDVFDAVGTDIFALIMVLICSAINLFCGILIIKRLNKKKNLNKLASLIVSSGLRRIDDIVRLSGMSEVKVIDNLRILTSASSSLKLGNDARYLKGGKLDLQTMEIKLSDKYIEKEPWTCVYCRAVNEKDALVCSSCHAPKKKV